MGKQRRFRASIHALRPGTWPASPRPLTVDHDLARRIAEAYDPAVYSAPVVLGHPQQHDPAWGDVLAASADERGLWLEVAVAPELAEAVRERRYRSVSVSLWPPDAPGNPAPGEWYLRHLGILGAAAPAVKGLAPLSLAETDGVVVVEQATTGPVEEETTMAETEAPRVEPTAAPTVDLAERERALAERERALAERERALRRAELERMIGRHVDAGRVLPADAPLLIALAERLDHGATLELAEGPVDALAAFDRWLERLPARVELRELAAGPPPKRQAPPGIDLPQGCSVAPQRLELWRRAHELAQRERIDLADAAERVERELEGSE